MVNNKIEIEGGGPIWRDPRRNSANPGIHGAQNGWMASQLVTKRCDLGSLGVPGPASTPLGPGPWRLPAGSRLLACLLCLALAWSGLVLSCLPCQQQQPAAFGGGCAAAVVVAGKAGKTGPGQTKPRQGTTSKPAKPRQATWGPGLGSRENPRASPGP